MPGVMLLPTLLSEISSHDLEVAETLIGVLRFMLIFVGARALSEILVRFCLLYTSPSPRDLSTSRMPSSA